MARFRKSQGDGQKRTRKTSYQMAMKRAEQERKRKLIAKNKTQQRIQCISTSRNVLIEHLKRAKLCDTRTLEFISQTEFDKYVDSREFFNDRVMYPNQKIAFRDYLERISQNINTLILAAPPGCGKTTIALNIIFFFLPVIPYWFVFVTSDVGDAWIRDITKTGKDLSKIMDLDDASTYDRPFVIIADRDYEKDPSFLQMLQEKKRSGQPLICIVYLNWGLFATVESVKDPFPVVEDPEVQKLFQPTYRPNIINDFLVVVRFHLIGQKPCGFAYDELSVRASAEEVVKKKGKKTNEDETDKKAEKNRMSTLLDTIKVMNPIHRLVLNATPTAGMEKDEDNLGSFLGIDPELSEDDKIAYLQKCVITMDPVLMLKPGDCSRIAYTLHIEPNMRPTRFDGKEDQIMKCIEEHRKSLTRENVGVTWFHPDRVFAILFIFYQSFKFGIPVFLPVEFIQEGKMYEALWLEFICDEEKSVVFSHGEVSLTDRKEQRESFQKNEAMLFLITVGAAKSFDLTMHIHDSIPPRFPDDEDGELHDNLRKIDGKYQVRNVVAISPLTYRNDDLQQAMGRCYRIADPNRNNVLILDLKCDVNTCPTEKGKKHFNQFYKNVNSKWDRIRKFYKKTAEDVEKIQPTMVRHLVDLLGNVEKIQPHDEKKCRRYVLHKFLSIISPPEPVPKVAGVGGVL